MEEQKAIERDIRQWMDTNRSALPLNVDSWIIEVSGMPGKPPGAAGPRYARGTIAVQPRAFYKPYSKIYTLHE